MKALSIKQPWALLIATGVKYIENRTWKTNYRGKFLIHASKYRQDDICNFVKNEIDKFKQFIQKTIYDIIMSYYRYSDHEYIFTGLNEFAIIGEVEIIDCVKNYKSVWAQKDCWNFVLQNAIFYKKPILNVKGALNFWNYEIKNESI